MNNLPEHILPDPPLPDSSSPQPSSDPPTELKELLEEIADDMLRAAERMKRIEDRLDLISEQVGLIDPTVNNYYRQVLNELDAMRRELLGERKTSAARSSFNAILPSLDALRGMRTALTSDHENTRIIGQLTIVVSSLENIIQSLGFTEFEATSGESFDPARMECLGIEEGHDNIVLRPVHSGYAIGQSIVRPCGVIIGRSSNNP